MVEMNIPPNRKTYQLKSILSIDIFQSKMCFSSKTAKNENQ